ncbi:hypothetical protein M9458_053275 [Cirrhinus mrigala]|uniref:Uncharacterized protein n=1 Tax=Cirrhinus mrigala TaxID=683832 RepID=A0ABD0MNI7_CIRMR
MCTDLTAKRMFQETPTLNRQPCKHDVCAAQHSIYEDEGNAVYSSVDECYFPELTRSRQRGRKPRRTFCDLSSDSGEECSDHRERIPTLRPGQFDGSTSWREFLNRFEDCAKANHWSERTMTVQMRFCLVGAAGAVIHKNPRSSCWDYARIVEEVEAAYSPSSEHAAAIGIELRQRVRRAGEPLHVLRDDIYEKVSIAYADRFEKEQDSISVEVFTNAMGDADIVQRLLEERPHRTRRTDASVTQLMQSAVRPMERKTRAAAVRECPDQSGSDEESSVPSNHEWRQKNSKAEFKHHLQKFNKRNKVSWEEIVCHNCQGIGHMRRNCPLPRLNLECVTPALPRPTEIQPASTVLRVKGSGPETCIHLLLYDMEVCALLDSGARRSVLPRLCYETIKADVRSPLKLSTVQALQRSADEQIQQNLYAGLASPNYRALNERTIKDAYPLPRIQDTLDTLSTAKWFNTLDLASGYWQVELTPQARQAAAFCSRKGLFAWTVMPFGLCNAPATFQRLMDRVLAGMHPWAVTVAEIIVSEWVCRYGAPLTLHSDQGTNFKSEVFQTMCELLDIDKTRTTPFRPQFNATLQKILATTSERCRWEWDLMDPYAVMAYRATKHSSTGFTPNMMLFGREITEPIDLVAGKPPNDTLTQSIPQYVVQMRERLELAHQVARDVLGQSVERAKKQYDKRAGRTCYKVGDAVWYLVKGTKRVKNKISKFLLNYHGPYFILGHLDDLVTKVKVVYHDKLKPYHSRQPLENSWVFKDSEVWQPALGERRGIEGGESAGYSLPPPSIPAGPGTRTRSLSITSPTP